MLTLAHSWVTLAWKLFYKIVCDLHVLKCLLPHGHQVLMVWRLVVEWTKRLLQARLNILLAFLWINIFEGIPGLPYMLRAYAWNHYLAHSICSVILWIGHTGSPLICMVSIYVVWLFVISFSDQFFHGLLCPIVKKGLNTFIKNSGASLWNVHVCTFCVLN